MSTKNVDLHNNNIPSKSHKVRSECGALDLKNNFIDVGLETLMCVAEREWQTVDSSYL